MLACTGPFSRVGFMILGSKCSAETHSHYNRSQPLMKKRTNIMKMTMMMTMMKKSRRSIMK